MFFAVCQQKIKALIPVFYPIFDYAAKKGLKITHRPERRFNAGMVRPAAGN